MDLAKLISDTKGQVVGTDKAPHWSHHVAAVTLIAGAVLLVFGRPRRGLAMAATGAATLLFERPEAAQEFWTKLPTYIKDSQEFLGRAETFIERIGDQVARIRETITKPA